MVEYTGTYLIYSLDKVESQKIVGLLEPLPMPKRPWQSVSLDFIIGLPRVGEYYAIVMGINRFFKYAIFIPMFKTCNVKVIIQLFFKNIVKFWGLLENIINDKNARITGNFGWNYFTSGVRVEPLNQLPSITKWTNGEI